MILHYISLKIHSITLILRDKRTFPVISQYVIYVFLITFAKIQCDRLHELKTILRTDSNQRILHLIDFQK